MTLVNSDQATPFMTPRLSVVMPVYNQERYVGAAIESILGQTFSHFEFIIVDDGSTDATVEVIRRYRDPRIRLVQAEHAGFVRALMQGFRQATGEWIARMDSDDLSDASRLAKQTEFLIDHPECVFVGTAYGVVTPNECFARRAREFAWRYVEPVHITLGDRVFGDPTVMFRRAAAESVGYYDEDFENEIPLWYRLLRVGRGAVLGETLYYTRWLMGSVSRSRLVYRSAVHRAVRDRYDPDNFQRLGPHGERSEFDATSSLLRVGVWSYLRAGDRRAAVRLAFAGWRAGIFSLMRFKWLVYALAGIEGLRASARRTNAGDLTGCAPPVIARSIPDRSTTRAKVKSHDETGA